VEIAEGAHIGHFTVVRGLQRLQVGRNGTIGHFNWISAYPVGPQQLSFRQFSERIPQLVVGAEAAITTRHIIDCTDSVTVASFATIAGYRSQVLTHAISLRDCVQSCAPVEIGEYSFVGTGVILLPGSKLPRGSVLGAGSMLRNCYEEEGVLYSGVPAVPVGRVGSYEYMVRKVGRVD
jgi:acetyltransferase-like isoleucine patch superfamily enzyme